MKKVFNLLLITLLLINTVSCSLLKDPITRQIEEMSLEEKIEQMIVVQMRYSYYVSDDDYVPFTQMTPYIKDYLSKHQFGGMIFYTLNFDDYNQSLQLLNDIKTINNDAGHIPMLMGVDYEGSNVSHVQFNTRTPGNMALAALGNSEDIETISKMIGDELMEIGLNVDFAPVADINSNPDNPVIGIRSFSDNPDYVSECLSSYLKGLNESGIISCMKHFPGHGDTDIDSHTGLPTVNKTKEEIDNFELLPFKKGIEEGIDMIMSAHIQYPLIETEQYKAKDGTDVYLPATLSKTFINDILREEMGYEGVVITDALEMDAINDYFEFEDVARLSINAGVDLLLMPVSSNYPMMLLFREIDKRIDTIVELVNNGEISEERINESVERILRLKEKYNITNELSQPETQTAGIKEHHQIENRIAKDAITLIENDNNILPLNKEEKTLIMVPYMSEYRLLNYGLYEIMDQNYIDHNNVEVYYYGSYYNKNDFRNYIEPLMEDIDNVIIVSAMYDNSDINYYGSDIADFTIEKAKKDKINTILLSANLPYDLSRFETDAKVACYYAYGMTADPEEYIDGRYNYGPNLIAAIQVIFGDGNPKGMLPVDIPELEITDGRYVFGDMTRYPRGTGLSY